jgi:beta-lactamase family protein
VRGCGVTNVDYPQPADGDTLFRIGSTAETFTGTAVMRSVEQGKFALKDTASRTVRHDYRRRPRLHLFDLPLEGGEDRFEPVDLIAVRRERHQDRGGDAGVAPLLDPFADAVRRAEERAIRQPAIGQICG